MSPRLRARATGRWLRLLDRFAIWIVLLVLLAIAALLSDAFLRPNHLLNIVRQAAPVGIAAVGVTLVMIAGGVDLSVGAVISLAAVVAAVLMAGHPANIAYAVAVTLVMGTAIGLANGVLIALGRVSPFILTLGMAIVVYGITQIYSGGTARGVVAPGFGEFFNARIGGLARSSHSPSPSLPSSDLRAARDPLRPQRLSDRQQCGRRAPRRPADRAHRHRGLRALGLLCCARRHGAAGALGRVQHLRPRPRVRCAGGGGARGHDLRGRGGGIGGTVAGLLALVIAFNLINIIGLDYNAQLIVKGAIIIAASAHYARLKVQR